MGLKRGIPRSGIPGNPLIPKRRGTEKPWGGVSSKESGGVSPSQESETEIHPQEEEQFIDSTRQGS